jgi:nitrite reductase (NO-forming)
MVMAFAVACVAAFFAVLAVGLAARGLDDRDGTAVSAAGSAQVIEVELGDLFVEPSTIQVAAGTDLTLEVTNTGAVPHDLKLDGETGTAMLATGESETIHLGAMTETSQAWCTVPGHKEAGMILDIGVTGVPADAVDHGTGAATADGAAEIDFAAAPGPDWQPFDPTLAPAPGGTVHDITLRATETVLEVAPGVTQEMWTFNDQVPGPVLRGKVGDLFNITLVNEGVVGHSIDLHASKVAWNDEMRTINTGESLVYQFEAKHAGTFMYHCGTAPALHHIGNGMHGTTIIDPPELAPVDHEVVLVQHELYLGPQGEPGDLPR